MVMFRSLATSYFPLARYFGQLHGRKDSYMVRMPPMSKGFHYDLDDHEIVLTLMMHGDKLLPDVERDNYRNNVLKGLGCPVM